MQTGKGGGRATDGNPERQPGGSVELREVEQHDCGEGRQEGIGDEGADDTTEPSESDDQRELRQDRQEVWPLGGTLRKRECGGDPQGQ